MSLLANYIRLEPEKPKLLKLSNERIEERVITDPKTKRTKTVRALVYNCTEEDGRPVSKIFSTLSEKLALQLHALWERRTHDYIKVRITRHPRDYATEYTVEPIEI